ncbi:MAG: acyl-CoA-binding protein [Chloroflexota bacterium]
MTLQDKFDAAMAKSREATLSDEQKVSFYSLMKQSLEGDASGERPSEEIIGLGHDAWQALAGVSQEEAMQRFVDLADTLP